MSKGRITYRLKNKKTYTNNTSQPIKSKGPKRR